MILSHQADIGSCLGWTLPSSITPKEHKHTSHHGSFTPSKPRQSSRLNWLVLSHHNDTNTQYVMVLSHQADIGSRLGWTLPSSITPKEHKHTRHHGSFTPNRWRQSPRLSLLLSSSVTSKQNTMHHGSVKLNSLLGSTSFHTKQT